MYIKQKFKINSSVFHSKAKYSPFHQMNGSGKAIKTYVNGKLVMDEGKLLPNSQFGEII